MDLSGQTACNNNNHNPLNQDLILKLVLEHVGNSSVTDLKNCRFVNHSWNRAAVQLLEQQHRYALALDLKNLDEFKNLLWRTQLSRLKSENQELKSLRLSFKLNSFISISEEETVEFVVGAASELGKAVQLLQMYPHQRVAFIDYTCDASEDREKGELEQPQVILVNQELCNLLNLTSTTLKSIAISNADFLCPHFEEFAFDSSLIFPSLTFLEYIMYHPSEERVAVTAGNEIPDLTNHVVSILQGAPKLTKLSLYLWDGDVERYERTTKSLYGIVKGCADHLEELDFEISLEAKKFDAFKALIEIKFPVLRLLKIIDGCYTPSEWFNLFLKNNCPILESLQVEWTCREKAYPMLLEFPTLPNILNFTLDLPYRTKRWYLERVHKTFVILMMGLPSLESCNLDLKELLMLGAHLKKSGHLTPPPGIYPEFRNISSLDLSIFGPFIPVDLFPISTLVYHHTFPNLRKVAIESTYCLSSSVQKVALAIEFLCSHPGIQILEIQNYAQPWLDHFSFPNQSLQGLKSLKLFPPKSAKSGTGPRLDPVQLVKRFPALEFIQFGKQMVSATQIQTLRDVLKIFENPVSN